MNIGRIFPQIRLAMSNTRQTDGVFAVHKPTDVSSAQVLRDLQRHFNKSQFFKPWIEAEREQRKRNMSNMRRRGKRDKYIDVKLGHGGTLDPIATGVLITAVGRGTKQLGDFLGCTKTYEAVVLFGVATDSYDRVGKITSRAPYEHITREKLDAALDKFRGKIMQRPSIFSALKVQGKKLYEYAREGIEPPVKILERPVEVSNLEVVEWYEPGSHNFVWPTEEVSEGEKDIAQRMNKKEALAIEQKETGMEDEKTDVGSASSKRKTPPLSPSEAAEITTMASDKISGHNVPTDASLSDQSSSKRQKVDMEAQQQSSIVDAHEEGEPSKPTSYPPPPAVKLTMTVSSGFYVRSLAHDLGLALGSNAIMNELVRTRQGDFELSPEKVLEYKDLEAGEDVWGPKLQRFLDSWSQAKEAHQSGDEMLKAGEANEK
ncbi:hypothetical protein FQN57_004286 [Myotisia sp. PD_48]|nr:hypothetical protein FQN57_004286 [Myotisia sp. PD_48]